MEIRVNVPEEVTAEAERRGLPVEKYVEDLLAEQVAPPVVERRQRTPEEVRAWLDALAQSSESVPPLPEVITRDWIYGDHD
jgi:hypothetical protein